MSTATAKTSQALKGEELKQEILRVALQHFAKKGFTKTNMDEIADEIGIHKPSIYYHIGKKEAVFDAVIISAMDAHLQKLQQSLGESNTPAQQLKAYITTFADNLVGENRYLANLLLRQIATEDGYFPPEALQKMTAVRKTLQAILALGIEKKVFKAVNPFMIHMLIVGFFTTYAASGHMKQKFAAANSDQDILQQDLSLHEAAEVIYGMLLDALRPE